MMRRLQYIFRVYYFFGFVARLVDILRPLLLLVFVFFCADAHKIISISGQTRENINANAVSVSYEQLPNP